MGITPANGETRKHREGVIFMALFGRRDTDDHVHDSRGTVDDRDGAGRNEPRAHPCALHPGERRGERACSSGSPSRSRGLSASRPRATSGGRWVFLACAGLALGLAQLFGGWTKWGWPTLSPRCSSSASSRLSIVGGWILLAKQPRGRCGAEPLRRLDRRSGHQRLRERPRSLPGRRSALIIGLVFAFSFDTTGPRTRSSSTASADRPRRGRPGLP